MKTPHVIGVISSLRSRIPHEELYAVVNTAQTYDELTEFIYKTGGNQALSNSEALLLAGLYGIREMGCAIKLINLKHNPGVRGNGSGNDKLVAALRQSSGLLLSTPVYFGDRSSLLGDLLKLIDSLNADEKLPLRDKGVGVVSVGAKRNGGQETTNIYALADCYKMGACIVGNGPPTSQYGGTGVGGAMGGIIDDHFGLKSAKGTGHRVGLLSRLLCLPNDQENIRILILITKSDRENKFADYLSSLPFSDNVTMDMLNIDDFRIKPCRACRICPGGNLKNRYTCVIKSDSKTSADDMHIIHDRMVKADGIIIANQNAANSNNDKFQTFIERTRFIRRNDFELTDKVLSLINISQSIADLSWLRVLTSFLRHNLFISGPSYMRLENAESRLVMENISTPTFVAGFESIVHKSKAARHMEINSIHTKYTPIGYPENKE